DRSGIIQGHPDVRRIGTTFAPPKDLQRVPYPAPKRRNESLEGNATILLVSAPILDANARILGTALVGMNRSHIERAINQNGEQWAAAEVGGDYFDVLPLPGGRIALAVADVSGKGLAGCLVTSMIFSLLRAYHSSHASPASLLSALDERLGEILQRGNFVTM